jgi:hypothetical protein
METPTSIPSPDPTAETTGNSWFGRLRRHPIFPLLLLLPITQMVRDQYPFSHYPMYSNPSPAPLSFVYLADAEGKPLPVLWHTGVTSSQVAKKFGRENGRLKELEIKLAKKEKRSPRLEPEVRPEAANEVLQFLRQQSQGRAKDRQLNGVISLMFITISAHGDRFDETHQLISKLPPAP